MKTSEKCPLCGEALVDIRSRQTKIDMATATEWGCWTMRDREAADRSQPRPPPWPARGGLELAGCGARGRFEQGNPVAKEPDSARLAGMKNRLIDAMLASSDRDRVMLLIEHFVSLRTMDAESWFSPDEGDPLWCEEHGQLEDSMRDAEAVLTATPVSAPT